MRNKINLALKIYSALLLILRIGVAAIVILAVLSFAVQQVSLENIGNPFVEIKGTKVIINVPVTIKNYGFYSIDNVTVWYNIKNGTVDLINGSESIGNIDVNTIETFDVPIVIDLEKIYKMEYPGLYHFTHTDILNASVTLSLRYMFRWVNISVNIDHKFKWVPPIEEIHVYDMNNIKMDSTGRISFDVPYLLKTASYLSGSANITGKILSRDGSTYGTFYSQAELGISYNGNIVGNINSVSVKNLLTHSQYLNMVGNISLFGFDLPFKEKYYWGAPFSGLSYKLLSNGTLYYSFRDDAHFPLSLKITKIYYYRGSEVGTSTSHLNVSPGEEIKKYEKINVSQPIDEVKIIFYEENTGITYEEVLHI